MRIKIENFCLFKESRTLRATCDITLGKTVTIHQVKIINGQSGLFVNMPTRKVGTQYEEICTILDENVKKEIRRCTDFDEKLYDGTFSWISL